MTKPQTNKTILTGLVVILVIIIIFFITSFFVKKDPVNKDVTINTAVNIDKCLETRFGSSMMYTEPEKQKECALLTLANAKPIEITDTRIGDTSLSIIKSLATGDLDGAGAYKSDPLGSTLKQCLDEADSNAATSGCLFDVEDSLQSKIRSMVLLQIEQEKQVAYKAYDSNPDLFKEELEKHWQDWYVSTTDENSIKAKECEIEGTKFFASSMWYQGIASCYIQKNADEIIWLLKQRNERKAYFEEQYDEMVKMFKD